MTILLRTGLAAGVAALALATSGPLSHDAPSRPSFADPPPESHGAAVGGLAALAVGGLGILARLRRR